MTFPLQASTRPRPTVRLLRDGHRLFMDPMVSDVFGRLVMIKHAMVNDDRGCRIEPEVRKLCAVSKRSAWLKQVMVLPMATLPGLEPVVEPRILQIAVSGGL